jgi:hypothetical protein
LRDEEELLELVKEGLSVLYMVAEDVTKEMLEILRGSWKRLPPRLPRNSLRSLATNDFSVAEILHS